MPDSFFWLTPLSQKRLWLEGVKGKNYFAWYSSGHTAAKQRKDLAWVIQAFVLPCIFLHAADVLFEMNYIHLQQWKSVSMNYQSYFPELKSNGLDLFLSEKIKQFIGTWSPMFSPLWFSSWKGQHDPGFLNSVDCSLVRLSFVQWLLIVGLFPGLLKKLCLKMQPRDCQMEHWGSRLKWLYSHHSFKSVKNI